MSYSKHVINLPKISLKNLVVWMIGIVFLFVIGHGFYKDTKTIKEMRKEVKEMKKELEEYQGRKDSVYFVTETIKITQPDNYKVKRIGRDTVRIWRLKRDTIKVSEDVVLDKVQKQYKDTGKYAIWISGYQDVWLDSLKMFPKTVYQKSTVIKKKRYNFCIGPEIGYGYDFNQKKLSPYIGIGLQWNFCQF